MKASELISKVDKKEELRIETPETYCGAFMVFGEDVEPRLMRDTCLKVLDKTGLDLDVFIQCDIEDDIVDLMYAHQSVSDELARVKTELDNLIGMKELAESEEIREMVERVDEKQKEDDAEEVKAEGITVPEQLEKEEAARKNLLEGSWDIEALGEAETPELKGHTDLNGVLADREEPEEFHDSTWLLKDEKEPEEPA